MAPATDAGAAAAAAAVVAPLPKGNDEAYPKEAAVATSVVSRDATVAAALCCWRPRSVLSAVATAGGDGVPEEEDPAAAALAGFAPAVGSLLEEPPDWELPRP